MCFKQSKYKENNNPTRITYVEFEKKQTNTKNKEMEISFYINKSYKRQTISTDMNKEVTGGAKVFGSAITLKEKQLFAYNERAPEVRRGGRSKELKVNTLGTARLLILDGAIAASIFFFLRVDSVV